LRKFYLYTLSCFIYSIQVLHAQVITIIDQNTLQPVENAMIYNHDHSLSWTTDHNGQTTLIHFLDSGLITINHPSYESYVISADQLELGSFKVALRQRIILIDEVVISANRWEQNKKQTPNRIVSVGSQEIEFSNPQTTADMLGKTNQVFIQKSQLGGGSPMIRGFAANSVLIVVDGVRMNNAIFRGGNLQNVISIDPFTLGSTEVLFGPGSVMYGSDALGGVMHFRTKTPGFTSEKVTQFEANSVLRYSSANNEKTGHIDFSIRGNKISQYTSFTYSNYQHLNTGNKRTSKFPDYGKRFQYVQRINNKDSVLQNPDNNEQVFSGYHQLNLLSKTRFRLGDKSELSYTLNYSTTSDIPRYDRLIETDENGQLKAGDWFYGPQKWLSNSILVGLYNKNKFFDGARLQFTLQNIKESRNDRDFGNDLLRIRSEKVDIFTFNFDLERIISSKHTIFYGLEWFFNQVDSKAVGKDLVTGREFPGTPRYPNGGSDYSGLAGYLSHKWQPSEGVAITSGLRYNQIWLDALYNDTNSPGILNKFEVNNGALNGSLGIAWLPAKHWQFNTLFSTGFRAPNVDDIGKIFDGSNGIVTVPNTDLKPEYSYNTEIGLTKSIEDKLKISATGYFIFLDNAIIQDDFAFQGKDSIYFDGELSKVQALVNTNSAHIYGVNVQLDFALTPGLGFSSSYTITQGEDSEGRPLRHTTPSFGFFGLSYRYKRLRSELSYRFNGKREFKDLAPSEQLKTHLYTPDGSLAWQTLNFSGSFHFSKTIILTAGVDNIFNTHYRPYSSGISAAGRNFIVALKTSL